MKPTKRQIELMEEIERYAGNLFSAAQDLLEASGDDPDVQSLYDLCELADSDVSHWRLWTATGTTIQAAIDKRNRADAKRRIAAANTKKGRPKAAKGKRKAA